MTSTTDPQADARDARMPPVARWALGLGLAALLAGSAYLVAVRGEALLVDLAALGSRLWCF
jgi:hypothetical protein